MISDLVRGMNTKAYFVYDVRHEKEGKLDASQVALNYLIQFIDKVSSYDDKLGSKHGFESDHLLPYLQVYELDVEARESHITLWENIHRGLSTFLSVWEVERTPVNLYLTNYARVSGYIQKDLVQDIKNMTDGHIKFHLFDIMAKKGSVLLKQVINRIDNFYSLMVVGDKDKLKY